MSTQNAIGSNFIVKKTFNARTKDVENYKAELDDAGVKYTEITKTDSKTGQQILGIQRSEAVVSFGFQLTDVINALDVEQLAKIIDSVARSEVGNRITNYEADKVKNMSVSEFGEWLVEATETTAKTGAVTLSKDEKEQLLTFISETLTENQVFSNADVIAIYAKICQRKGSKASLKPLGEYSENETWQKKARKFAENFDKIISEIIAEMNAGFENLDETDVKFIPYLEETIANVYAYVSEPPKKDGDQDILDSLSADLAG